MKQDDCVLEWLQKWYTLQCDGDWEHEFGISIDTVDNPGWYVTINLIGTAWEDKIFISQKSEVDKQDWFFCLVKEGNFEASCSPNKLATILNIFRNWVEK